MMSVCRPCEALGRPKLQSFAAARSVAKAMPHTDFVPCPITVLGYCGSLP